MSEPFVKIYKKLLKWEWYDDVNTCRVFIHCLLKANWKSGSWHGVEYQAGEFITSLETLANETSLTVMQVRTAIRHLVLTGEITSKQQGRNRIITVNNWNDYQDDNKVGNSKVTRRQQDDNKVVTTEEEYKEYKELKEIKNIYGEYKHVRLTQKQYDKLVTDFGERDTDDAIRFLDEYIQMKGYKAKDHNLAIRKWVLNAVKEDRNKRGDRREKGTNESDGRIPDEEEARNNERLDEHIRRVRAGEFAAEDEAFRRSWDE